MANEWRIDMALNIDHMDAIEAIETAYQLLLDFQAVINTSLEGDHPMAEPVDRWLSWYERNDN